MSAPADGLRREADRRTPPSPATTEASVRQDAVTVVLSAWLTGAVFSDGWAHHNVPELEGFFTPWHGALYAGFAAVAIWMTWLGRAGGLRWHAALPAGYRLGAVGLAVFGLGGLADMAWHLALGVEAGVDALLSPTHLMLFAGGLLILTSALRSRWGASDTSSVVAQSALALATSLVAFFLLYVSEFTAAAPTVAFERLPEGDPGHTAAELPAYAGLGGFLITTVLLVVPLLLVWRQAAAPRGQVTVLVGTVSFLSAGVENFGETALLGAVGATAGAVLADLLTRRLDRRTWSHPGRRLPVLAAVTAASIWSVHVATLAVGVGLAWPPELWSGVVVLSTMTAAGLAALANPGAGPLVGFPTQRVEAP